MRHVEIYICTGDSVDQCRTSSRSGRVANNQCKWDGGGLAAGESDVHDQDVSERKGEWP